MRRHLTFFFSQDWLLLGADATGATTLVQASGSEAVYLVSGGQLLRFVSAQIFSNLKYSWLKVKKIPAEELAYYPTGDFVKYKDGTLIRPDNENNVYIISGGKPQVVDSATFKKKKYKWANVLVIAALDFQVLYRGGVAPPPPSAGAASSAIPSPLATPSASVSPLASPTSSLLPAGSGSTTTSPVIGMEPKIRVAIYEVIAPSVTLTASTAFNVLDRVGQIVATKNANENYIYSISASSTAFIKIAPQSGDGIVQMVSYEDHPVWKPSLNYNQFHGTVEIIYSSCSVPWQSCYCWQQAAARELHLHLQSLLSRQQHLLLRLLAPRLHCQRRQHHLLLHLHVLLP